MMTDSYGILKEYAKRHQVVIATKVHFRGHRRDPVGASRMEQLEQAVAALEIALRADDRKFLEDAYVPHAVLGHH
jgi:aryl-alcohol dehydrogenase-like predicted oxidoreductase